MFNLVHNIDFVLAAIGVLLVAFFGTKRKYNHTSKANAAFYRIAYVLLAMCLLDVILTVAQSYQEWVAFWVVQILYAIVNTLHVVEIWLLMQYLQVYEHELNDNWESNDRFSKWDIVQLLIVFVVVITNTINIFSNIIGYVDFYGNLIKGPLFLVNSIMPILGLVVIFIYIIPRKNLYTWYQFWAVWSLGGMVVVFSLLEDYMEYDYLFRTFVSVNGFLMLQLSLESPDYENMRRAVEEKKKIEEELQKANDTTVRYLAEIEENKMIADLSVKDANEARRVADEALKRAKTAEENAQRANYVKEEFLKRVSIDLRTPINAVYGFGEVIENKTDDENIRGYAGDIRRVSSNLLDTVNDMLDFSLLEKGNLHLDEDEYDIRDIIRDTYHIIKQKAQDKNVKVVFDVGKDIPYRLIGDEERIRQVLLNLLTNALKYTDVGNVSLSVSLAGKGRASVMLKFVVKDTGKGIKEEDLVRIYDDFERIEYNDDSNIGGSGLGLAIVSRLLTMMGSKINVESVYGLGSQFSFSLKQSVCSFDETGDFKVDDDSDFEESENVYAPGCKALVVDDSQMHQKVMKGLLKNTEIVMETAESVSEALNMAEIKKYNIIFLDDSVWNTAGENLCNKIKSQAEGMNKDTGIVVLTANTAQGSYEKYIAEGFDDVLYKPVMMKSLNAVLVRNLKEGMKDYDI